MLTIYIMSGHFFGHMNAIFEQTEFAKSLATQTTNPINTNIFRYKDQSQESNKLKFEQKLLAQASVNDIYSDKDNVTIGQEQNVIVKKEVNLTNGFLGNELKMKITKHPSISRQQIFTLHEVGTYNYNVVGDAYNHLLNLTVVEGTTSSETVNLSGITQIIKGSPMLNDFDGYVNIIESPEIVNKSSFKPTIVGTYIYNVEDVDGLTIFTNLKITVLNYDANNSAILNNALTSIRDNAQTIVNLGFTNSGVANIQSNSEVFASFPSSNYINTLNDTNISVSQYTLSALYVYITTYYLVCGEEYKYDINIITYSEQIYDKYLNSNVTSNYSSNYSRNYSSNATSNFTSNSSNILLNTNLDTGWSKRPSTNIKWNEISPPNSITVDGTVDVIGSTTNVVSFNSTRSGYAYWYSYRDYAPMIPNVEYTASIYVKTDSTTIIVRAFTANNTETGRIWTETLSVSKEDGWKRLEWTFTNPINSQSESLSFQIQNNTLETRISLVAPLLEVRSSVTDYPEYRPTLTNNIDSFVNYNDTIQLSNVVGGIGYILARKKGYANAEIIQYIDDFYNGIVQAGINGYTNKQLIICAIGYADYLRGNLSFCEPQPYTTGTIHKMDWRVQSVKWNYGSVLGYQWSLWFNEGSDAIPNGSISGPLIKMQVGDIVDITVHNEMHKKFNAGDDVAASGGNAVFDSESVATLNNYWAGNEDEEWHGLETEVIIHWHGIELANYFDGTPVTQSPIMHGDSYAYRFRGERSGIFWYHPHWNSLIQNSLGLNGGIVIEDTEFTVLRAASVIPHEDRTFVLNINDIGFTSENDDPTSYLPYDQDATTHVDIGTVSSGTTPNQYIRNTLHSHDGGMPGSASGTNIQDNWGDIYIVNGKAVSTTDGQGAFNTADNLVDANSVMSNGAMNVTNDLVEVAPGDGLAFYLINSGLHRYYKIKALFGSSGKTSAQITSDEAASSGVTRIDIYRLGGEGGLLSKARLENGSFDDTVNDGFHHQPIDERTSNEATDGFAESEAILIQSARTLIGFKVPPSATGTLYLVANGQNNVTSWGDNSPTNLIIAKFNIISAAASYEITDLSITTALLSHASVGKVPTNLADDAIDGVASHGATIVTGHTEADIVAGLGASGYAVPTSVQTDYTILLTQEFSAPSINGTQVEWDDTGPMQALQDNTKYLIKGEVVEFTVENTMSAVDHPWHPHGFSFQPIKMELNQGDTDSDGVDNYKVLYEWDFIEYMDVFNVPAKHRLTYRFIVDDRPYVNASYNFYWGGVYGRWLGHCHIFKHAHMGMMADMIVLDNNYMVHSNNFDDVYEEAYTYSDSYGAAYDYADGYDANPIGQINENGETTDDILYEDLDECTISMTDTIITDASWWSRSYHPPGITPGGHYIRKFACDMTNNDWAHTRFAFAQMCDNGIMHEINVWHRGSYYMHEHSSPLSVRFGSWHRDMLRYFEYRLHEADPCAILPVWNFEIERDPLLDIFSSSKLQYPHDITDTTTSPSTTYSVTYGAGLSGGPLKPIGRLQTILDQPELELMLRSLQGSIHDRAHVWWSESMGSTPNAAACLPFYALHGMVDWIINHWLTGTSTSVPPVASNKDFHLHIDPVTGAGTFYRKGASSIVNGNIVGAIEANDSNWGLEFGDPTALATLPADDLLPDDSVTSYRHSPWNSDTYLSCDTRTPMLVSNWNSSIPGTDGTIVYPGYVYNDSICGTIG